MWTIISGYFISIIFEYLTTKLHKNNLSNKNMSFFEIVLGWLFQEHVRQDFNMTGGKRFMIKIDFRNRFITQSVKIIRNIIFWIHVLNILELGTFIILFCFFTIIFIKKFYDFISRTKTSKLDITSLFLRLFVISKKEILLFVSFLTFLYFFFFKTYSLFDFFFVLRPFVLLLYLFLNISYIFWFSYLLYNYMLIPYLIKFGKLINVLVYKTHFYLMTIYFISNIMINEINFENITVQNFFKELLFKLLCFTLNI